LSEQDQIIESIKEHSSQTLSDNKELRKNIVIHGIKSSTDDPDSWFQDFCNKNLHTTVETEKVN